MRKSGWPILAIVIGLGGCATQGLDLKAAAYAPAASVTCSNFPSPLSRVALVSATPVSTCGTGASQFQGSFSGANCRPPSNVFSR
jgi:hypothetical protein